MKIIKQIEKAEITICTVLYAAMVLICFANVCSRFLFHFSFAFAEELELIAFIWSIMLGIFGATPEISPAIGWLLSFFVEC